MKKEIIHNAYMVLGTVPDNVPLQLVDTDEAPESFFNEWPESGGFYRATQNSIPGFDLGYLVAHRARVRMEVIPYFVTDFQLNAMLEEGWIMRLLGGLSLRVACIGHPTVSFGRIDGQINEELLGRAFAALSAKKRLSLPSRALDMTFRHLASFA